MDTLGPASPAAGHEDVAAHALRALLARFACCWPEDGLLAGFAGYGPVRSSAWACLAEARSAKAGLKAENWVMHE